jgi:hypothetical protein
MAAVTVILNLILVFGLVTALRQVLTGNLLMLGFGLPASAAHCL